MRKYTLLILLFTIILISKSNGQVSTQILITPNNNFTTPPYWYNINVSFVSLTTSPYPLVLSAASSGFLSTTAPSWTPSNMNPATVVLIEFGDGTFSFKNIETHAFNETNHKYDLFTKATGLYDPDTRPPRATVTSFNGLYNSANPNPVFSSSSPYARGTMNPGLLNGSQKILVQPNINSLVAGDTMIFIVTYKLDSSDSLRKIFFNYNNDDFFEPLSGSANEVIDKGIGKVPYIRFFRDETFTYQNGGAGYNNRIIIDNLFYDGEEHNIFITLVPRHELNMRDLSQLKEKNGVPVLDESKLTANIRADLVDNAGSITDTSKNELEVRENSHDPNYVSILPKCLPFPKTTVYTMQVHAHCQNIGFGPAIDVRMAIAMPSGLNSADIYDTTVKLPPLVIATWDLTNPDSVIVRFARSPNNPLVGIGSNPLWLNDPNTMGDVWFKVKTNPSVNNVLQTQASIVFCNTDSSINPAVLTNIDQASFSSCCNCKKATDTCGCNKKKSRFWKWLFCKKC
jgi:hypothetical protein